jgi:rod shape-determining protein MreB
MIGIAREAVRSVDLAVDFGTASVRLTGDSQHVRERRSVYADRRALAGGVVVDREAASELLRPMLYRARRWAGFSRIRVLGSAPSDASAEEKTALADCIVRAGASAVHIAPEPLAAAIGAGMDVGSPYAKLLVDIGEGVTDCAVIRCAQVVQSLAVRVGCSDLRKALQHGIFEHHQLSVHDDEVARLLRVSGVREDADENVTIEGSRVGKFCALTIRAAELHALLTASLAVILGNVETLLNDLPAALSAEVIEEGIYLSGGGALLKGMPEEIVRVAQMDVRVVADPLGAVTSGLRAMLPVASTLRLFR